MRGNPSITEQAIEVEEEENDDEEALPADDEKQTIGSSMINPLDDLKSMGEAGRLIEQIPLERRINQRIDFQVSQVKKKI
jgi:UDP-N-acetylenolpyruvoylglucosamine reductase